MKPTTWTWRISAAQLRALIRGATYTHHQHGVMLTAKRDGDGVLITVALEPVAPAAAVAAGELAGD